MAITAQFSKTSKGVMPPWAFFVVFPGMMLFTLSVPVLVEGGEQYRDFSSQELGQRLERFDRFDRQDLRVNSEGRSQRFWDLEAGAVTRGFRRPRGDRELPVEPDPRTEVIFNNKPMTVEVNRQKVSRCSSAVSKIKTLDEIFGDKGYAKALVELDRDCLAKTPDQPNLIDPGVLKRALVIMAKDNTGFCTGLLLDETTLLTARHCFIARATGEMTQTFATHPLSGVEIQTVDMKRRVVVSKETIESLKLSGGFDIDQDPVKLPVLTIKESGAPAFPSVHFTSPQEYQLLLIAGPFALLNEAQAILSPASTGPSLHKWQDSIRWSAGDAAQCRIEAISPVCIYHTCQTSSGYSGSPMISAAKDGPGGSVIEYVGVHSGTPGFDNGGWSACSSPRNDFEVSKYSALNVGKNGGF